MYDEDYILRTAQNLINDGKSLKKLFKNVEEVSNYQSRIREFSIILSERLNNQIDLDIASNLNDLDFKKMSAIRIIFDIKFDPLYLIDWRKRGRCLRYIDEVVLLLQSLIFRMRNS